MEFREALTFDDVLLAPAESAVLSTAAACLPLTTLVSTAGYQGAGFVEWALAILEAGGCLVPVADDHRGPALDAFAERARLHHLVEAEGAEARVRYAQLLERTNELDRAKQQYAKILAAAELAPKHFRKAQKEWLAQARDGATRLR